MTKIKSTVDVRQASGQSSDLGEKDNILLPWFISCDNVHRTIVSVRHPHIATIFGIIPSPRPLIVSVSKLDRELPSVTRYSSV